MGFIAGIFGWILKNPIPVAVLLVSCFLMFQCQRVEKLTDENKELGGQVEQLNVDQQATAQNLGRVNELQSQIAGTRNTQTIIRERIQNVPVIGEDRPFVNDPALLDRADIMRDYQERYTSPTTAEQPDAGGN